MSKETLNKLVGLAMIDPDFCEELLADPLTAALKHGLQLTPKELEVLRQIKVDTIYEFSEQVLDKLMPDD
ncbi:MAG TPA: Os1348 family NHLP clan protein [Ktedonobacteraceae bacterium]|nr:Os1348 family NHLP clan protein [Ktedonobacteraceae bacterium]